MTKKVNYPTQIIPTTSAAAWRKAIKDAEAIAQSFTAPLDAELRIYYFGKADMLKVKYADWRKAQRHPIDFKKEWLENEERIAKHAGMTVLQYQDLSIQPYFDLQELYIKHLETERSRALSNKE